MANQKYEQAKRLRELSVEIAKDLQEPLTSLKHNLEQFYELMRWHDLECSNDEYNELFENIVYEYENNDIDGSLENLLGFLSKICK